MVCGCIVVIISHMFMILICMIYNPNRRPDGVFEGGQFKLLPSINIKVIASRGFVKRPSNEMEQISISIRL